MTTAPSILEQSVPPYRMLLPAGWSKHPADRASLAKLTDQARSVFRAQHRPDLDSEFTRLMEGAARRMKRAGVVAIYLQTSTPEDEILPMSLTASIVRGPLGGSLDRQVTALFRDRGAVFLTDDRRIIRWRADVDQPGELAGTSTRLLDYLVPIPGTNRREALQLTTTLPYPTGDDTVTEFLDQLTLLSDTVVSTFEWEIPGE